MKTQVRSETIGKRGDRFVGRVLDQTIKHAAEIATTTG